ncbi:hypothetical protein NW768_010935 [Fusarium equiseti]|uniref:Uncharacterized protein n=1 Tax=Fusarium equiseti TaxID=61235 RepID=A0ABQ8QZ84_FUSEQ|nr:hypothetical protein NW768_010935 [Fusarium equiseti]
MSNNSAAGAETDSNKRPSGRESRPQLVGPKLSEYPDPQDYAIGERNTEIDCMQQGMGPSMEDWKPRIETVRTK